MKIAFHAPLKSPNHPVPSGDRLMARLMMEALRLCGHQVDVASEFRSFSATPDRLDDLREEASREIDRLERHWDQVGRPDLWFCYHPYYKSPDLIGPALCRRHGVAYVTAEASYSPRRNDQGWQKHQALLAEALMLASVNLCLTARDLDGIERSVPGAVLERLPPFIDPASFEHIDLKPKAFRLIAVAMMRPGDKMSSYGALALALNRLVDLPWTLSIVGDGPRRAEVETLFAGLPPDRIVWHGQLGPNEVAGHLGNASLYVWPGHGEAYGLAYLEAQAAGLPVVAENVAGVPEVVADGRTGFLTPAGDVDAFAAAIRRLLTSQEERREMAKQARQFVFEERSLDRASTRLGFILDNHLDQNR